MNERLWGKTIIARAAGDLDGSSGWGDNVIMRVEKPTSGGWRTFDFVIIGPGPTQERRYADVEDDFSWQSRLWNWAARPFRRWRTRRWRNVR